MSGIVGHRGLLLSSGGSSGAGTPWRYWRVYITSNNGDTLTAMQEIELRGSAGGSDLTNPSMTAADSSNQGGGNTGAKAFDNDFTTSATGNWISGSGSFPQWVSIDLGSSMSVAEIAIWPQVYSGGPARAPKDFLIEGSSNGSSWTTVATVTGAVDWVLGAPLVLTLPLTSVTTTGTVALLHLDGSNGATLTSDSSPNASPVSLFNGAAISTAQSVFGGSSIYFDGVDDFAYLSNEALRLGNDDFTIDFRMYSLSTGGGYYVPFILGSTTTSGVDTRIELRFADGGFSNAFQAIVGTGTTLGNVIGSGFNKTTLASAWHAVRLARASGTFYFYIDGNLVATNTQADTITVGSLTLGRNSETGGQYWNGYLDEVRIYRGTALSTGSSYTVDVSPFP